MSAGAVVSGLSSVNNNAYLTIQPTGADEWVIHNIHANTGGIELHYYDGANDVTLDVPATTLTWYANLQLHCTATRYYRVKNVSGGALLIGYDGMQTA